MALSEKQLQANQANAQKSTGPQTGEGKKRSSLNAFRHGITGQVLVLPEEEMAAFQQHTKDVLASYDLDNQHEEKLATVYATSLWQLERAQSIEANIFTLGLMEGAAENLNLEHAEVHNAASFAKTFRSEGPAFARIGLYLQRLTNQAQKHRKELEAVIAARHERQQAEMDEAILVYKFKKMQGEPFVPAQNGFVSSTRLIEAHLLRESLLGDSQTAKKCGFDKVRYMKQAA